MKTGDVSIRGRRRFGPHLLLLDAAQHALDRAETQEPGYFYEQLMAMTFAALAIEALGNSFGKMLIHRWDDFESSSPIAKLRVVCDALGVTPDWEQPPWSDAIWLVRFRNTVAHAKLQPVEDDRLLSLRAYEKLKREKPAADLEKAITAGRAKRGVKAVRSIKNVLCQKLPSEKLEGLLADAWSWDATWTSSGQQEDSCDSE